MNKKHYVWIIAALTIISLCLGTISYNMGKQVEIYRNHTEEIRKYFGYLEFEIGAYEQMIVNMETEEGRQENINALILYRNSLKAMKNDVQWIAEEFEGLDAEIYP